MTIQDLDNNIDTSLDNSPFASLSRGGDIAGDTDSIPQRLEQNPTCTSEQVEPPDVDVSTLLLPYSARVSLVRLMKTGVLLKEINADAEHYCNIVTAQAPLRLYLSQMFVSLIVDEQYGCVLLKQSHVHEDDDDVELDEAVELDSPNSPVPKLITDVKLNLYATILLVMLRKYYFKRENQGEKLISIEREELRFLIEPYLGILKKESASESNFNARVKTLHELKILRKYSAKNSAETRMVITPLIRYMINAKQVEEIINIYKMLAKDQGIVLSSDEEAAQSTDQQDPYL